MSVPRMVSCPRCSAPVEWGPDSRFRPFCSERCKFMDLGAWATEKFRIPEPEQTGQDLPEEDER